METTRGTPEAAPEMQEIRAAMARARERIGAWEIRSGRWFEEVVESYLAVRQERHPERVAEAAEGDRVALGEALIRRACALLGLSGAGSGIAWTAASVAAAQTNGFAGLLGFPLAGAALGADLLFRTVVQLALTSDLAELYGFELRRHHTEDVVRLHALALEMVEDADEEDLGRGAVQRVVGMDAHEVGKAVGTKLVSETLLRNVVPYLGVLTSAYSSVRLTWRIGEMVRSYLTYRRALLALFGEIERRAPDCVVPLTHGVWAVFTADGRLTRPEAALLADLVRQQTEEVRHRMFEGFEPRPEGWLDGLARRADDETRDFVLHALEVAAAVDTVVDTREIAVLNRVAEALGRSYRREDVEGMAERIERTGTWDGAATRNR